MKKKSGAKAVREVSNAKLFSMLVAMGAKMATKDDLKRFATKDDLKRFATKDDLKNLEKRMATKDDLKNTASKADVDSLYRMMATKEDLHELRKEMATKNDLDELEERILAEMRPMSRAQDKDALTVVDHEARIVRLEELNGIMPPEVCKTE